MAKKKELSASEALYGFCGWLTSQVKVTKMGAFYDSAPIVELVDRFITTNNLAQPRKGWDKRLKHPANKE